MAGPPRSGARAWFPMLLWMALIFVASHQPADALVHFGSLDFALKKTGHFVAYGILGALALRATGKPPSALVLVVLYAMSDEYHQTFVPGRTGSPWDVLIDIAGGLFAVAALQAFRRRHDP